MFKQDRHLQTLVTFERWRFLCTRDIVSHFCRFAFVSLSAHHLFSVPMSPHHLMLKNRQYLWLQKSYLDKAYEVVTSWSNDIRGTFGWRHLISLFLSRLLVNKSDLHYLRPENWHKPSSSKDSFCSQGSTTMTSSPFFNNTSVSTGEDALNFEFWQQETKVF